MYMYSKLYINKVVEKRSKLWKWTSFILNPIYLYSTYKFYFNSQIYSHKSQ